MCADFPFAECHSRVGLSSSPSPSHRRYNSLPIKILRVSSLQSRFWRPIRVLGIGNLNKTQQLFDQASGTDLSQFANNSFVWKILRVNSSESRFCSANSSPRRAKLLVIKILSRQDKKRTLTISLIPLPRFSVAEVPLLIERGIVN